MRAEKKQVIDEGRRWELSPGHSVGVEEGAGIGVGIGVSIAMGIATGMVVVVVSVRWGELMERGSMGGEPISGTRGVGSGRSWGIGSFWARQGYEEFGIWQGFGMKD
jgi:hypothetical protein